ncbi:ABC transporter ATP-binding protein [Acuticoccus sp.]|uniref:ABC transporter ATP-binding protein n=1 Tax=Acuticoccus sp. TaxID=1904378 RepID=UPI003B528F4D
MLELRGVGKRVGDVTHLDDVTLELVPGTINVLLGPTLAGKTSLLRLMAGLDRPTSGTIQVDGRDVTGVPVRKRDVAMVYQQFINYPAMTVRENIASPMRLAGKPRREVEAQVGRIAALLQLVPYLDRLPLQLSGGQQQRTAIARALAKDASVVLLDEPLANLDYKLREELRAELPKVFQASGAVVVYATAEPEEALLLGGNTATLSEGGVTQFGPTLDVYRAPNCLTTARTFSDPPLNVVALTKSGGTFLHESGFDLPVPPEFGGLGDGRYVVGVRPHHLAKAGRGTAIALPATVVVAEITGSESYVHMTCLDERFVMLIQGIYDGAVGTTLNVGFEPRHMLVFNAEGDTVSGDGVRLAA